MPNKIGRILFSKINEILDAYHEALQKLKDAKNPSKQEQKILEDKKELIQTVSKQTPDQIVKNLANLKLSLAKSLEDIEEKLLSNQKKLSSLQQSIEIQTQDLEELHEIKINTHTLAALRLRWKNASKILNKRLHINMT